MIELKHNEQRWLEIIFYLLCRKIYSINHNTQDIIDFINGFRWTNMFNCDILIETLEKEKILLNPNIIPSKHEYLISMNHPECRLRITPKALYQLTKGTEYKYKRKYVYHAKMREEIKPTTLIPKIDIPNIHETIYSFLITLRYIGDIVHKIKF